MFESYHLIELGSQEAYNQTVWQLKALEVACKTAQYLLIVHEDQITRAIFSFSPWRLAWLLRFETLYVSTGQTHSSDSC